MLLINPLQRNVPRLGSLMTAHWYLSCWLQIYLQLAEAQQKELSALKAELTAVKAAAEAAGGDANAAKAVGMRAYKECARIKVSVLHNACLPLGWRRQVTRLSRYRQWWQRVWAPCGPFVDGTEGSGGALQHSCMSPVKGSPAASGPAVWVGAQAQRLHLNWHRQLAGILWPGCTHVGCGSEQHSPSTVPASM